MRRLTMMLAAVAAGVAFAPAPAEAQTTTLDRIEYEVTPGAFWHAGGGKVSVTLLCEAITPDPIWGNRNSVLRVHFRTHWRNPDGTTWDPTALYSSRHDDGNGGTDYRAGAQICDLRKGVDTVTFNDIFRPATRHPISPTPTREDIKNMVFIIRMYPGRILPEHMGLKRVSEHKYYGWPHDNYNDGPDPAEVAAEAAAEAAGF